MLNRLLELSVRNRWLVVLLTLTVSAYGLVALQELPIDAVPDITNNQVQINSFAPALSPTEVEKQVTFPIENALAGIPGLEYTRSLSRNGFSQVTAVFEDGVNIYFARQQVGERLSGAKEALPPQVDPKLGPIATGLGEIYMYTISFADRSSTGAGASAGGWQGDGGFLTPEGQTLRTEVELSAYLREVQDWIIRPQLSRVKGVAGVDAIGGRVKQYQIQPDPLRLVSFGVTFDDIILALESNNLSTGAGYIEHRGEAFLVRAAGRIEDTAEIALLSVVSRDGVPIYLKDLVVPGGIMVGKELRTGAASADGKEVVVGTVIMLIGANSRDVASRVDQKMQEVTRSLPAGVRVTTVLSRTKLVDATIATVKKNLIEGAVLVIVILFLMLGNFRAAFICALAIPLSMLLTAIGMVRFGISGNLMSLGAIDFGLVVDGAVIIVENCLRRLAEEQHRQNRVLSLADRLNVVTAASSEVRGATAFGEAIIITVYIPILALTGVEGKMFHPMALTVILALVAAFVLSLSFVPALVAILVSGKVSEQVVKPVQWITSLYEPTLRRALVLRTPIVAGSAAAFLLSLLLFQTLGQEFVPTLDEKDVAMHAMRIPSTSLSKSLEMQLEIEQTLRAKFPEISLCFSKTGTAELAADPMPPNVSDTFIILKPEHEWRPERELAGLAEATNREAAEPIPADQFLRDFEKLGHKAKLIRLIESTVLTLPGHNYEFTQPIQMRFNELISGVRSDVAIKVFGDDFDRMRPVAERVLETLRTLKGVADPKVEQTTGLPVMKMTVKRPKLARYGLTVNQVQDVIAAAVGGRDAGVVFEGDRRFKLAVRLPDALRENLSALKKLPVPLPKTDDLGRLSLARAEQPLVNPLAVGYVPLDEVVEFEVAEGPNQISRENGKRRIVVQANVRGRDLGSFVEEAQQRLKSIPPPPGGWFEWGGQYENLVAAKARLMIVVPACFMMILLLLYFSFKSVGDAALVFAAVPLGLTGGVVALWLRGLPFSISAAVGFIALSGVAVLNGLVMVTFINQLRDEGKSTDVAIVRGAVTRLRPVLMTALVASLGFLPMALATGTGAEVQRPLATVVIGGLVTCTPLTLFVLPALYKLFSKRKPAARQDRVEE